MVIDGVVLLDVIAGLSENDILAALQGNDLFTTGCWYYRLSRAVHSDHVGGSLSLQLAGLDVDRQVRVVAELDRLLHSIGRLSLRDLVPVMRALRVSRPLNLLNAEALAAALVLDAELVVSTDGPLLRTAAEEMGVGYWLRSR